MAKRKLKKNQFKKLEKLNDGINSNDNPLAQKFALIIFGLGPLVIVFWFLLSKGFFEPV